MSELRTDITFAMVPMWLMESGVSNSALRVYISLAKRAHNETGVAWPKRSTIGKDVNLSLKSVDRGIAELCEIGALTKHARVNEDGNQTSNMYVLNRAGAGASRVTRGDTTDAPPRQDCYTELDQMNYTNKANQEGADAPTNRHTDSSLSDTGRELALEHAAAKSTEKAGQTEQADGYYVRRLIADLVASGGTVELDEDRLAENYRRVFQAAVKAGKNQHGVAVGLTVELLARTFDGLPKQANGLVARLVKANGGKRVLDAAVVTVNSPVQTDPKYAADPLGPVKYLAGVVRS